MAQRVGRLGKVEKVTDDDIDKDVEVIGVEVLVRRTSCE